jgi:uncharacterized protein (TIGR02001 family)
MRFSKVSLYAFALATVSATPAIAQDAADPPAPITVSGSVALVSDYRLRGISQTDKNAAVQGGITISHESGLYLGAWGSNLSGWGTFGGANVELDAILGYKTAVGDGGTLDVGVTWYTYPGGFSNSDVFEGFAKLAGTTGPLSLTAGAYYAPKQQSIGNYSATPFSRGQRQDNLYLTGDAAAALPTTPVTLKAHIGYSNGNPGLGPNGTSLAPTGEYFDWALGADVSLFGKLTFNVSYIDTDIGRREAAYLQPNFSKGQDGTGDIADPTIVFSVSTAF